MCLFKVRDFESIRDEILNNISAKIDKREGTFTYDMISGVAVELAKAYMSMEDIINLAFIEDGFDTYLDKKVSEILSSNNVIAVFAFADLETKTIFFSSFFSNLASIFPESKTFPFTRAK